MSLYTKIIDLQKLNAAWQKVKKNKPAAGVDHVTYEMFDAQKREALQQLQMELRNHTYEALPVKRIEMFKGNKSRTIALYSMRDKVLQQSINTELNRIYEPLFSSSSYAYRNNKSALTALDEIEKAVKSGDYKYVIKVDIEHFFDTIDFSRLKMILEEKIKEQDVLDIIKQNVTTRMLEETGEIVEPTKGIHQGSVISPILSNIYLMKFDHKMSSLGVFYIRYSDDILILCKEDQSASMILKQVASLLDVNGLQINDRKTYIRMIEDGFEFLGHAFSTEGRSIPPKAKRNLNERLETMWLTSALPLEDKIKKAKEIISGWEQYFSEERDIETIFEFVALMAVANTDSQIKKLVFKRDHIDNIYKDIAIYLAEKWRKKQYHQRELFEYEQLYQISNNDKCMIETNELQELLSFYRRMMIHESEEVITEIMQIYTDAGEYQKASFWMEYRGNLQKKMKEPITNLNAEDLRGSIHINHHTKQRIQDYFLGREDIYSLETISAQGKRQTEIQLMPVESEVIEKHLQGEITLGTYIQRPNATVKYIVFDIDISKRILLQYQVQSPEFREYLTVAWETALQVQKLLRTFGMESYIEFSGFRGYHVWLMMEEWISTRYANMFCDLVNSKLELNDDITIEYFPNKTKIRNGKYGQCIKLPYGVHAKSGQVSYFVDQNGNMVEDVNAFIDIFAKYHASAIKRVLAMNTDYRENVSKEIVLPSEEIEDYPVNIRAVLNNCNLMKYLYKKVSMTGYLSHFERLSILYVFGHMGEEGHDFIHIIMGKTLNYQFNVTDRFINKIPAKPISCLKLREQYKNITAEYGCSCNFKRTKNCYPSPVLHAIQLSNDVSNDITIPTSRTLTKEKEKQVIDELNIHKKAEELATKILEYKKQKRKLDSFILKVENELCRLYDSEKIDCLETELGMLVRRKIDTGYEWLIEL